MGEVDAAQFPDDLRGIGVGAKLAELDSALHQRFQHTAPVSFELDSMVTYLAIEIVEFKQSGGDRAPAPQPGPGRPAKPMLDKRPEPRQAIRGGQGRCNDVLSRYRRHAVKQVELQLRLRPEVGE